MATGASPPELLLDMLAEDRAAGYVFDDVFAEDVACAAGSSTSWREALEDTRGAWQASWDNAPGPGAPLSPDMTYDASDRVPTSSLLG